MQFSIIGTIKMIYQLFFYVLAILSFLFNLFWIFCNFLPFLSVFAIVLCLASNLIKLAKPKDETVLGEKTTFAIAHRAAHFDFPENSVGAIKHCLARKCDKILLDLTITADNHLVILHKTTLEKSKINEQPETIKYEALQNFNISEHHPLGQHFPPEVIMTLPNLLRTVEDTQSTIYLLAQNNSGKLIDALAKVIEKDQHFTKRFVFCSKSPLAIYKLRKMFPDLVCGLWLAPQLLTKRLNLLYSVYNVVVRNFVAGVTGISAAFIHKDEYNASISKLWATVDVRPIVYFVNSPNEKRYFQQVTKTQYVTDSLRSEPQNILNGKLNYP